MKFSEDKWKYIFKMFLMTIGIISIIIDTLLLKINLLRARGCMLVVLGYLE